LAGDWAASFYDDDSLEFSNLEFRTEPLRFWLVTFKTETDEEVYAVVLPDGTIVEPQVESQI